MQKSKSIVVCSGGLDSTVLLYYVLKNYGDALVLTFDYGQNHQKQEHAALTATCKRLGVEATTVSMRFIKDLFKSSLLGGEVPEGHYASDNMKSTVVPFRNGIMLAVAAGFAESNDASNVFLGNHGGDHFIYPDCRPEFTKPMHEAVFNGTSTHVKFIDPFVNFTKADIVKLGAGLGVDFKSTYSCYKGGEQHCGKCGTCVERKEAFLLAGVEDPTRYMA